MKKPSEIDWVEFDPPAEYLSEFPLRKKFFRDGSKDSIFPMFSIGVYRDKIMGDEARLVLNSSIKRTKDAWFETVGIPPQLIPVAVELLQGASK